MKVDIRLIAETQGCLLTDEQMNVVNSMDDSLLITANPGTGKTTTMVYGLLDLVLNKEFQQERILCMSYTNNATNQIKTKYAQLCDKTGIKPKIEFRTFHSFCSSISRKIMEGMTQLDEKKYREDKYNKLRKVLDYFDIKVDDNTEHLLMQCIDYADRKGITDEDGLSKTKIYRELVGEGIDYNKFMFIRDELFKYKKNLGELFRADTPLYTLDGIANDLNLVTEVANKYDVIVVDEFQDMNFIYMILLSLVANKLVAIGDIKQQIYRYNGSDDSILEIFKLAYPFSKSLSLTQSFRCDNKIAEFSSKIIRYNNYKDFNGFKGVERNGELKILKRKQFQEGLKYLYYLLAERGDWSTYLFLYRFRMTGFKIIHEMYNYKYIPLYQMEYIRNIYLIHEVTKSMCSQEVIEELCSKIRINDALKTKFIKFITEIGQPLQNMSALGDYSNDIIEFFNVLKLYNDSIRNRKISEYIDKFQVFINKFFTDNDETNSTLFTADKYIKLLNDSYGNNTMQEMIDMEKTKDAASSFKRFPIRVEDYQPLYTSEFFSEIDKMYELLENPSNLWNTEALYRKTIFYSFKSRPKVLAEMEKSNSTIFEAAEKVAISAEEAKFIESLRRMSVAFKTKTIKEYVDGFVWFMDRFYSRKRWKYYYEHSVDSYCDLICDIYGDITWSEMKVSETEKMNYINNCNEHYYGIQFKTLHSAKGLEAHTVFFLDYDHESIPNKKYMENYERDNLVELIAESIRDERCLTFVGLTRAKVNLYCIYDTMPTLFNEAVHDVNCYEKYDAINTSNVRNNIIVNKKKINLFIHDGQHSLEQCISDYNIEQKEEKEKMLSEEAIKAFENVL